MNKLRELIAAVKNQEYLSERKLEKYLYERRDEFADLIDEAQKIGLTLRDDHPLTIALAKLEK
jgi:hypothetical protein